MNYRKRLIEDVVCRILRNGKSILLLGPRQTGKTTLMDRQQADYSVTLMNSAERHRYERNPSLLPGEIEALPKSKFPERHIPLVTLDEIQKVPDLLDEVQVLCDRHVAAFILTGSSARRLRAAGVNLLPGRVVALRLDPLSSEEAPEVDLEHHLIYGSLPGIVAEPDDAARELSLQSYVTTYLDEEVRAEALVRNLGSFSRFLELAAAESGLIVNYRQLSEQIGVAHTTIAGYYQILEDCLIAERIEPITQSATRKRLTKSSKHLFFDLGVRRAAAREGAALPITTRGFLFEQFVGLEILRYIRSHALPLWRLRFWRDPDGPEVDWVVDEGGVYVPIEVKHTDSPVLSDARHLVTFMSEYKTSGTGYIVCRTPVPVKLSEGLVALPWQNFMARIIDHGQSGRD